MANRLLAAAIFVLSGVYMYAASQLPTLEIGDPLGPKVFPYIIGVLGMLAAGWLLIETAAQSKQDLGKPKAVSAYERPHPVAVIAVLAWMLAFYLVLEPLGFILGCFLFLLGLMAYFNRGRWVTNLLVSALFPLGVYFGFTKVLGISLPAGILPL